MAKHKDDEMKDMIEIAKWGAKLSKEEACVIFKDLISAGEIKVEEYERN